MACCAQCGTTAFSSQCGTCGTAIDPLTGLPIPAPGVCAPGPGNEPITDDGYQSSLGVCLQDAVDGARHLVHELGLRAYRVRLVWWARNRKQRFQDVVRELELVPVKISALSEVRWRVTPSGMDEDGGILLSQISPAQVGYTDLIGQLNDADPEEGTEFFYEVEQIQRCAGGPTILPGRYTPISIPYYDATTFGWVVAVGSQNQDRADVGAADRDQTFNPRPPNRRLGILRT